MCACDGDSVVGASNAHTRGGLCLLNTAASALRAPPGRGFALLILAPCRLFVFALGFLFLLLLVPPPVGITHRYESISRSPVIPVQLFLCDFRYVLDHEVITRIIDMY